MSDIDRLIVSDTETTGLDAATCSLLEVAAAGADFGWYHMVRYDGDIPPEAKATHHITEEMVALGAPKVVSRETAVSFLLNEADRLGPDTVFCFHNAEFDRTFLPELADYPVLCTYRAAKHLYPDAPSFKNQVLRYWLGVQPRRELLGYHQPVSDGGTVWTELAPHRALYDVACTLAIAERMLETHTLDELLELSVKPVLLQTCHFGKYKGEPWATLARDSGYVSWMRRSGNWEKDIDVMHTLDVLTGRKAA